MNAMYMKFSTNDRLDFLFHFALFFLPPDTARGTHGIALAAASRSIFYVSVCIALFWFRLSSSLECAHLQFISIFTIHGIAISNDYPFFSVLSLISVWYLLLHVCVCDWNRYSAQKRANVWTLIIGQTHNKTNKNSKYFDLYPSVKSPLFFVAHGKKYRNVGTNTVNQQQKTWQTHI